MVHKRGREIENSGGEGTERNEVYIYLLKRLGRARTRAMLEWFKVHGKLVV